jgi:pyridoxamine 5'-phosphate oxidase
MEKIIHPTLPLAAEAVRDRIWQELTRSTVDRHHEWRSPVLSTIGLDGLPQARTVVLRKALKASESITIFTDSRTPKVAELIEKPAATLTFWSKRLGWQCRMALRFQVFTEGEEVDTAWQRMSQSAAAKDYLAVLAPGSPINSGSTLGATGAHHLTLLVGSVVSIDWLELGQSAHRRIKFFNKSWQEVVA